MQITINPVDFEALLKVGKQLLPNSFAVAKVATGAFAIAFLINYCATQVFGAKSPATQAFQTVGFVAAVATAACYIPHIAVTKLVAANALNLFVLGTAASAIWYALVQKGTVPFVSFFSAAAGAGLIGGPPILGAAAGVAGVLGAFGTQTPKK